MSDYFEAIEPMDRPNLPEELRGRGPEGMLPGQIVFPHGYQFLLQDDENGALYIRLDREIDDDAHNPKYMGGRFGLMRVYMETENGMLDGFVADLRLEGATNISKRDVEHYPQYGREQYQPLAGIIYADLDRRPRFRGNPAYAVAAANLAHTVDGKLQKDEDLRSEEAEPVTVEMKLGASAIQSASESEQSDTAVEMQQHVEDTPQLKQGLFKRRKSRKND